MHILYLGWANHIHLRRWAAYFAKLGHKITILSLSPEAESLRGVQIIRLFTLNSRNSFQQIEVALWTKFLRPHICHVHWAHFGSLVKKNRKVPYGITVWGSDIYNIEKQEAHIIESTKRALHEASFITCDSQDLSRRIHQIAQTHPQKVHVIQWGVDTTLFYRNPDRNKFKKRYNIPENSKVILSIRNIDPIYQPEIIIKAFARLTKNIDNIYLIQKHYHADNNRLHYLKKLAESEGVKNRIIWVGNLHYEELPSLYNISDVVVSIPLSDGTPMSLLEAMACGVPPIVSDLPSIREWIRYNENGVIVLEPDPYTLADAISILLRNKHLIQDIRRNNFSLINKRATQHLNMLEMNSLYSKFSKDR